MEHAHPEALAELEDVPNAIRSQVKDHGSGHFYWKGKSLTHLHVDPSGVHADAKIGVEWVRRRVTFQSEKTDFLALIERQIETLKLRIRGGDLVADEEVRHMDADLVIWLREACLERRRC